MADKSLVLILQNMAIAILFFEFVFVLVQKPSEMQKHSMVLTLAAIFMFVGYNIELRAASIDVALTGTAVAYIGKPFVMLSSFLFICSFYNRKISNKVIILLALLCTSFSILVFTNNFHHLYYATTGFDTDAKYSALVITRGPLYYTYVILAIGYFVACLYVVITGSRYLQGSQSKRLNIYIVLMVLSGILGYVVYLSGITGSYDSTMAGVFISVICLFIMFVRCRIFDAVVIGKDRALDDSTTGLVIFDYTGQVSYQNSIVSKYLEEGISLEFLRDMKESSYQHIWEDKAFIITSKSLMPNGVYVGKSVEINDITELHNYQSRLEHDVKERTEKIAHIQREVIGSVANIVEARSTETGEHIKRTSAYTEMIARAMQKKNLHTDILNDEYIELLVSAAPLHDIGKISVPDQILLKPGKLTEEEFSTMTTHVDSGTVIIENSMHGVESDEYVQIAKEIAQYHHEHWDGTGYGAGLSGEDIPLSARIVALADCLDALLSERCYKKAYSFSEALEIIQSEKGTHFDPDVVEAFEEVYRENRENFKE